MSPLDCPLTDHSAVPIAKLPGLAAAVNIRDKAVAMAAYARQAIQVRPRVAELHGQYETEQSGQHRKNRTGMRATVWRTARPLPNEGAQ
jgi:hypothetical protein